MVLVDTNILAYLLIEGERTAAAQELFARDPDWRSEAFILVEFCNVIATQVRYKTLSRDQGTRLLAEAQTLMPELRNVQHARALDAAIQFGISAYDARFVALAMQMKVKLVTEDVRLRSAVPDWTASLTAA